MTDKTALRRAARLAGQTRMPGFNAVHASTIARHALQRLEQLAGCETIGMYHPLPDEIDSRPLIALLRQRGYRLALPRVALPDAPLAFHLWAETDRLETTTGGVWHPRVTAERVMPDVIILPLLGFTAQRYRLGRGGGHYDRTLAARPRCVAIGLAAAFQEIVFTPEAHDRPLHAIVTEHGSLAGLSNAAGTVIMTP